MRAVVLSLFAASCTCGHPFEPLDGGSGGGSSGMGGGTGGGGNAPTPDFRVPMDGIETSIAVGPDGRPQILARFTGPILAEWTGSAWDVRVLFDAGTGLVDDLTLAIDVNGLRHMSWTPDVGNVEYATWDGTALTRYSVFKQVADGFGGATVSPRDHGGLPVVAYVQQGSGVLFPGTHVGRQQADGGFTDVLVECCITRNTAIAARADGGIAVAWEAFNNLGMRYAEEQPDGGFTPETFAFESDEGQLSMAFGPDGAPQLLFQHAEGVSWATRDAGGWSIEDVEPPPAGEFTSLAVAADGSPRAVFTARDGGVLVLAKRSSSGWSVQPIAANAAWPSVAVDTAGASHVSYYDMDDGGVRYLKVP